MASKLESIKDRELVTYLTDQLNQLLLSKRMTPLSLLPRGSFLAGGAIGNLILSKYFGLDLPINDIDVFIDENLYSPPTGDDSSQEEPDETYFNPFSPEESLSFRIVRAKRDRILNTVITQAIVDPNCERYSDLVLNSFDFNCVEAGLYRDDSGTWQLKTTTAFQELLKTREVAVTQLSHPFRTLLRLYKKKSELKGLYFKPFDEDVILQVLAYGKKQSISRTTLEKHFVHCAREVRGLFSFKHLEKGFLEVLTVKNHPRIHFLNHKERLAAGRVTALLTSMTDVKIRGSKALRSKYRELAGYPNLLRLALRSGISDALHTQSKQQDLLNAERALILVPNILKQRLGNSDSGFSFSACVGLLSSLYSRLKSDSFLKERNVRNSFCGFVDVHFKELLAGECSLTSLRQTFLDETNRTHLPLVQSLEVSANSLDTSVRELVTEHELKIEGAMMGHCVGGYSGKISSGQSRIFALMDSDGGRTTLEVGLNDGNEKAFIIQLRGRFNCMAPKAHMDVAIAIISQIRKIAPNQGLTGPEQPQHLHIAG